MKLFHMLFFAAVLLVTAGCSSFQEEIFSSDISMDELEKRMQQAMDPNGRFIRAGSYIMRQQITTDRSWMEMPDVQMVEIKFRAPDQFKLTTYTDNEPEHAIIANGSEGWFVDMKRKKVIRLEKNKLEGVLTLARLTNPGIRLKNVFSKVSLDRSRIGDEVFYRLTCSRGKAAPIYLYVGSRDFFSKRLRMATDGSSSRIDYDSRMLNYSMHEGVMIPDEAIVQQGSIEQKSKVIYYKLDVSLEDKEFLPPLF
jgi:outer membrane lipoprotein-sorting protein